jgi:hypothetical protein
MTAAGRGQTAGGGASCWKRIVFGFSISLGPAGMPSLQMTYVPLNDAQQDKNDQTNQPTKNKAALVHCYGGASKNYSGIPGAGRRRAGGHELWDTVQRG